MLNRSLAISLFLLLTFSAGVARAQATQPTDNLIHRAGSPASSATETKTPPTSSVLRVAISLGAVLALIVILYWAGRRMFPRAGLTATSRAIQVLARTPISPKHKVVVIRIGKRILLVGEGGQQLTTLCEITDADEVAALLGQLQDGRGAMGASSFASMLNSAADRFRSADRAVAEAEEQNVELAQTHDELNGLAERVRVMAKQIGKA